MQLKQRRYTLTFFEQHHHIALHNEHLFSPGVYQSPESLREPVIFMCFCSFLCFTSDCSAVWQGILPHGQRSIWGKLLFLWGDVSASGHRVRRHLVTSLLVLPGTLRLWGNDCAIIHLGSAWELLWQIYWFWNIYPSRTSKPIYIFTHTHSRERERRSLRSGSVRCKSTPHFTLANLRNEMHHFFQPQVCLFF